MFQVGDDPTRLAEARRPSEIVLRLFHGPAVARIDNSLLHHVLAGSETQG